MLDRLCYIRHGLKFVDPSLWLQRSPMFARSGVGLPRSIYLTSGVLLVTSWAQVCGCWVNNLRRWTVRVSLAGDVAVVMFLFFGHLGGEKHVVESLGGGGASEMTSPISRFEGRRGGGQRAVR
jgi:hypothetical protein